MTNSGVMREFIVLFQSNHELHRFAHIGFIEYFAEFSSFQKYFQN